MLLCVMLDNFMHQKLFSDDSKCVKHYRVLDGGSTVARGSVKHSNGSLNQGMGGFPLNFLNLCLYKCKTAIASYVHT